jgi:hypothetical protein
MLRKADSLQIPTAPSMTLPAYVTNLAPYLASCRTQNGLISVGNNQTGQVKSDFTNTAMED